MNPESFVPESPPMMTVVEPDLTVTASRDGTSSPDGVASAGGGIPGRGLLVFGLICVTFAYMCLSLPVIMGQGGRDGSHGRGWVMTLRIKNVCHD